MALLFSALHFGKHLFRVGGGGVRKQCGCIGSPEGPGEERALATSIGFTKKLSFLSLWVLNSAHVMDNASGSLGFLHRGQCNLVTAGIPLGPRYFTVSLCLGENEVTRAEFLPLPMFAKHDFVFNFSSTISHSGVSVPLYDPAPLCLLPSSPVPC